MEPTSKKIPFDKIRQLRKKNFHNAFIPAKIRRHKGDQKKLRLHILQKDAYQIKEVS